MAFFAGMRRLPLTRYFSYGGLGLRVPPKKERLER
jgi:hypothetical protein